MFLDLSPLLALSSSLPLSIILLVVLAFMVGVISSLFGVGGGFFFTPFFSAVLQLPATQAVATSMTTIPFQSASATVHYLRHKVILYREAVILLLFSLFSSQFMAGLLTRAHHSSWGQTRIYRNLTWLDISLVLLYCLLMASLATYSILQGLRPSLAVTQVTQHSKFVRTALIGLTYGALSSLLGIGGGFLTVPYFMYVRKTSAVQAVATSLFLLLVTTFFAALQYIIQGQVYGAIALLTALGTIPGAQLGSRLSFRTNPQKIKLYLGCLQWLIVINYLYLKFFR